MSRLRFTGTVIVVCRHVIKCPWCACRFHYDFDERINRESWSESEVVERAPRIAEYRARRRRLLIDCPNCGRQPDRRAEKNLLLLTSSGILATGFIGFFLMVFAYNQIASMRMALCVIGMVIAMLVSKVVLLYFARNKELIRIPPAKTGKTYGGTYEIIHDGKTDNLPTRLRVGIWLIPLVVLLDMIAVAYVGFLIHFASQADVAVNHGVEPTVVSPGSKVDVTMPKQIRSVDGDWEGTPEVTLVNDREIGKSYELRSLGSSKHWEKGGRRKAYNQDVNPIVTIFIPDDDELVGKSLVLRIVMVVTYPSRGLGKATDVQETFEHSVQITISSRAQSAEVSTIWRTGYVIAFSCLTLSFALLALRSLLRTMGIIPPQFEAVEVIPKWE